MTVFLFLALVVTWVTLGSRLSTLNQRLTELERQLRALAEKAAQPPAPPVQPAAVALLPEAHAEVDLEPSLGPARSTRPAFRDTVPMPMPTAGAEPLVASLSQPAPEPVRSAEVREAAGLSFMGLIKRNLFASAGIGLLLLGFTFLLSALSWRELLSPGMRIGLAWLAAAGMGYAGWRFGRRNPLWGQILQGGAVHVQRS